MEFGSLGSFPGSTWSSRPVDKSVDNVDNWEFGEFGEFNEEDLQI